MNSIKMNRIQLLDIVVENNKKHIKEYLEAVEDYKLLVVATAQANLKLAKTGELDKFKGIKSLPPIPTSYEDSYRRAIRMLELSVEEIIEVEEDVFNQLVLDEWSWKRSFTASNATYKVGSAGF